MNTSETRNSSPRHDSGDSDRLSELHPNNRHVRPKIRQQLQVLRDLGFVAFLGRGRYRLKPV
ncbi:MAG: hypothetical protein HY922_02705 [Elusimicrobia bacterium]|nr:hypothetical protein [Elusimicrobiota bacterium]